MWVMKKISIEVAWYPDVCFAAPH